MKKRLALLLACTMALSLTACGGGKAADPTTTAAPATTAATEAAGEESKEAADTTAAEAAGGDMDALIEAAKAEGELTVYGSCEEEYLSAACQNFEKLYGIKTKYQRLSTSEVYTKISEEAGKPSADVWFGGTTDPYDNHKSQTGGAEQRGLYKGDCAQAIDIGNYQIKLKIIKQCAWRMDIISARHTVLSLKDTPHLLLYRDTDALALRAAPGSPNSTCRNTCRRSVSKNNPLTAISHRNFSFFIHHFNPNGNIMIVAKL